MSAGARAALEFGLAAAVVGLVTVPVAIRVAGRTGFYDRPREYRQHARATPFLGGAAVLLGFLVAALVGGDLSRGLIVAIGLACAMWLLGTIDDAVAVAPRWRLLATAAAAGVVYAVGLGWSSPMPGVVNLVLTLVWIVGLVNAFNLMDNLDGACGTVAAVSAAGIGALALVKGQPGVAALAFGLSGACAGFLPWNLSSPARIFLGDGGSMPIGFLLAVLAMAATRHSAAGHAGILVGALLVGLPILDVMLVSVSRSRRGVSLLTGGRDHLTHRILLTANTPRRVALALGAVQLALCTVAVVGYHFGEGVVAGLGLAAFLGGIGAILLLDRPQWRPPGIAVGEQKAPVEPAPAVSLNVDSA